MDINSDGALDLAMNHYYFNMEINDGEGNFADTFYINENSNDHEVMALAELNSFSLKRQFVNNS